MKWKYLLFLPLIALLIFGGFIASSFLWPHPSDKKMLSKFFEHRREFERLLTMIQEDTQVDSVSTYSKDPVHPSDYRYDWNKRPPLISDDRLNEYQTLMRNIGIRRMSKEFNEVTKENDGPVHFLASFDSCCDEGEHWVATEKGYAFGTQSQSKIETSLDTIDRQFFGTVYSKMDVGWHLYFHRGYGKPE